MIEGTAIVTGASRGIGAATVRKLVAEGVRVHALARASEALDALCAETGAVPLVADLGDTAGLEAALSDVAPNILINNAGVITSRAPLHAMSRDDVDEMVSINVNAVMHTLRIVLPGMVERGTGDVVLIGSIAGQHPFPGMSIYGATKSAIHSLAGGLRLDLHGTGVRVSEVAPGRVETEIALRAMGGDRDALQAALFAKTPSSQPEDIADAVIAALAMPRRSNVTRVEVVPSRQTMGGALFAEIEDDDG